MPKLIMPKHTGDLDYIFSALKIYYDDKGWLSTSEYRDRLVSHLLKIGKESSRNRDGSHYTKCAEIPRYFAFLERKEKGNIYSDVRITRSGISFYESYIKQDYHMMYKLIMDALATTTFGRNNEGCGSDTDIEPPAILLKSCIALNGLTSLEFAYILSQLSNKIMSFSEALLSVSLDRKYHDIDFSKNDVTTDIKFITFLKNIGFLTLEKNGIINVSKYVLDEYHNKILLLRIYNDILPERLIQTSDEEKIDNDENLKHLQKVYYGSPGTGKSFKVKQLLENVPKENVFRTTFHPDSDYSSFVGSYKPLKEGDSITYNFEPQVFIKAYVQAWQNRDTQIYLVIEEINRGNCAQIFGDLFQLLDKKNGISEYPVKADAALAKYLSEVFNGEPPVEIAEDELLLPENLNIIATMNTSDQSLFPMDSAFKRRWDWVYIPTTPPTNKEKNMTLHIGENNTDFDGKAIAVGDYEYKWTDFLNAINKKISAVTHSDDKQLGFWFVKTPEGDDEISVSTFVSKVIFYLWNDVFKDMGPKGDNPFTVMIGGKNEVMTFNAFFEVNSKGKIVENLGVLHTFMHNLGLDPKLNKEIETAQQASDMQDETVQQ